MPTVAEKDPIGMNFLTDLPQQRCLFHPQLSPRWWSEGGQGFLTHWWLEGGDLHRTAWWLRKEHQVAQQLNLESPPTDSEPECWVTQLCVNLPGGVIALWPLERYMILQLRNCLTSSTRFAALRWRYEYQYQFNQSLKDHPVDPLLSTPGWASCFKGCSTCTGEQTMLGHHHSTGLHQALQICRAPLGDGHTTVERLPLAWKSAAPHSYYQTEVRQCFMLVPHRLCGMKQMLIKNPS